MNARPNDRRPVRPGERKSQPSFVKGVALVATGLVVTLGVGTWIVGSQDRPESGRETAKSTRTNASRPEWAKRSAKEKRAPGPAESKPAAAATVATGSAGVETSVQSVGSGEPAVTLEPTAPVRWADAEKAWDAGDWNEASGLFGRYAAEHPGNPWGHYMLGLSKRQTGELEGAEVALLDCLTIDPDHAKALVNLARVRLDLDRAAEAREPAARAIELDSTDVAAHRTLARVLHTQGLRDEAEERYLAALALDPDDAWSLNNVGLLRIEEERFEEAVSPLERACAVDAGQALFFNNLGVALERTERYRAAEEAYAKALQLDPAYAKAEISLARVIPLGEPRDGAIEEPGVLAEASVPEAGPAESPESAEATEVAADDGGEGTVAVAEAEADPIALADEQGSGR
jgi:Flp pilus assembly protein TadD